MERFDFVNRANAEYIDRLYEQYQRDPRSIDPTWQAYFAGFEYASGRNLRHTAVAPTPASPGRAAEAAAAAPSAPRTAPEAGAELDRNAHIGIYDLVHSYRELGH